MNKGHIATTCNSSACRRCQKKYNTLLHQAQETKSTTDQKSNEISASKPVVKNSTQDTMSPRTKESSSAINLARKPTHRVVLSTAQAIVEDANGNQQSCHALLDAGSQSNLVTQELVNKLKLKCIKENEIISGINKSETKVRRIAKVNSKA